MIQFLISKRWSRTDDFSQLAHRVMEIVRGSTGFTPYKRDDKSAEIWHLDSGNDWWLEIKTLESLEAQKIGEVRYRYDHPNNVRPDEWAAIKTVIEWAIGTSAELREAQEAQTATAAK